MSVTLALSNALSGLVAASRGAETVADNVANAATPGYTRKTLGIGTTVVDGRGAGVRVVGAELVQDPVATADKRRALAEAQDLGTRSAALTRLADAFGEPGEADALAERLAAFDGALRAAADSPASEPRLQAVLLRAQDVASAFRSAGDAIQRVRDDADGAIAQDVDTMNSALGRIETLNSQISRQGADSAALQDERKRLIDQVSEIVPVRVIARDRGQVALFTEAGERLLDGPFDPIEFSRAPLVTEGATLGGGGLSGLSRDGDPLDLALFAGGRLAASFAVRDDVAPEQAARLDAMARDLIERFEDPSLDPTLLPGAPGLFTDGGTALDPSQEIGLARRLAVTGAVDPASGGEVWRLRDGVGATTAGPVGEDGLLRAMSDALSAPRAPLPGLGTSRTLGAIELAADRTADLAASAASAEESAAFAGAQSALLVEAEAARLGVDTDQELQSLLLIEQIYAANARVITVADTQIQRLLEI